MTLLCVQTGKCQSILTLLNIFVLFCLFVGFLFFKQNVACLSSAALYCVHRSIKSATFHNDGTENTVRFKDDLFPVEGERNGLGVSCSAFNVFKLQVVHGINILLITDGYYPQFSCFLVSLIVGGL